MPSSLAAAAASTLLWHVGVGHERPQRVEDPVQLLALGNKAEDHHQQVLSAAIPVVVKSTGRRGRLLLLCKTEEDAAIASASKRARIDKEANKDHCNNNNNKDYCTIQYDDDASVQKLSRKLVVPIFSEQPASVRGDSAATSARSSSLAVVVTADTTTFRNLAATQLVLPRTDRGNDNDEAAACHNVLEIGCSTGETSLLVWKQACVRQWMGWDTGAGIVQQVQQKLIQYDQQCNSNATNDTCGVPKQKRSCHRMDPLMDPDQAVELVWQEFNSMSLPGSSLTVLVDIGGDRLLHAVVMLLHWIVESLGSRVDDDSGQDTKQRVLRQIIVKSETLFQSLRDVAKLDTATASYYVAADPDGEWWNRSWRNALRETLPRHPLQAPRRVIAGHGSSSTKIAICRYHNYCADGCKKYNSADGHCPLDHDHCHLCLRKGHTARICDWIFSGVPRIRDD